LGWTFSDICNLFLGYNVTFANDVIKLNGRKFPEWGECMFDDIVDYQGNKARVVEPCALALYPMSKTVNDTLSFENAANMRYAVSNNPSVNTSNKLVYAGGIINMNDIGGVFNA